MVMAAVDRVDLKPIEAQAANTRGGQVATDVAQAATPSMAATPAAAKAAASMWVALPVITAEVEQQGTVVGAALAARGVNIATRNSEAVATTVEADDQNRQSLTPEPVISV
jgi:hypothetical protein